MLLEIWIHIVDMGDGSAVPKLFSTEKEAEKSADKEFEDYGQAICDNVTCIVIDTTKFKKVTKE